MGLVADILVKIFRTGNTDPDPNMNIYQAIEILLTVVAMFTVMVAGLIASFYFCSNACATGFGFVCDYMLVALFLICIVIGLLLVLPIPWAFLRNLMQRFGFFLPILVALYQAGLLVLSNIFSLLQLTCTICIPTLLAMTFALLIFEYYGNRAHILNLAATVMSLSMSMAVTSFLAGEIGIKSLVGVWALAAVVYYVADRPRPVVVQV